jgi:hypothetical protein
VTETKKDLQRCIDSLERRLAKAIIERDEARNRAAWYRAKLLGFVTTKWIKQERESDGRRSD